MTKKTACAIGRACAQSTAAGSALPIRPAAPGASLAAIAESGGRRHCLAGMAAGLIFNH